MNCVAFSRNDYVVKSDNGTVLIEHIWAALLQRCGEWQLNVGVHELCP